MKSAYELAMERLSQGAPTRKLTPKQKSQLAELDSICRAKIAELEIRMKDDLAAVEGDDEKTQSLRDTFSNERRKLEELRDARKAAIRGE